MRARDVMVRAVATTTPDATVETVARLMINLRISGVPVLDRNGQLVGIVTEGDLLRRVETGTEHRRSRWSDWFSGNARLAAEYVKAHARRVEDVMTRKVVTIEELAGLDEIAELMESNGIKRVPVVHDGKIVGIVSRADLCWRVAEPRPKPRTATARYAGICSPSWICRNGRARPKRISSSRTGSCISGAPSDRRRRERRCASSPKTSRVSAVSRIT